MLVVFGVALLVLAAAVVVVFAMLAELASRVSADDGPDETVLPVEGAVLGRYPGSWPAGLPSAQRSVVVVLSTICRSCAGVAAQLSDDVTYAQWEEFGVLIVATGGVGADEFIERYRLRRFRHHVDENGVWISGEFGVRTSPVALVFRAGRLESAYTFSNLTALRARIDSQSQADSPSQGSPSQTDSHNQEEGAVV